MMDAKTNGEGSKIFNLFVRLLNGNTLTLKYSSPTVHGRVLKQHLSAITGIPFHQQRLVTGLRQIDDDSVVSCSSVTAGEFPTVHLLLRLVGGKGGFGSLLRGAATKAGQKKTNNFDACRDMSGRRLRHVNAEKKLEEWKAEEEERRLEKIAEEFLKKKVKDGKKGSGNSEAQKYVAKYREESARCVAKVEESVREAVTKGGNGKRKGCLPAKEVDAKKLKIWMGKRKLGESDSDDTDEDDSDSEENEKSVVLNDGSQSDSSKEVERSPDTLMDGNSDGKFSARSSSESGSEEEKETIANEITEIGGCTKGESPSGQNYVGEHVIHDEIIAQSTVLPSSEAAVISENTGVQAGERSFDDLECVKKKDAVCNPPEENESASIKPETNGCVESKSNFQEGNAASACDSKEEKPINFDDFSSAAEMEVLGLERLKSELQARGLKCGGTLKERAARLFLLKSTALDKLPKKLLAKN